MTRVAQFLPKGLDAAARFVSRMRRVDAVPVDDLEDLLKPGKHVRVVDSCRPIDRTRVFRDKLDMVKYFTEEVFTDEFLAQNQLNAGLWTWMALAYSNIFIKARGSRRDCPASVDRWIYKPESMLVARRHFVAGHIYLYRDFKNQRPEFLDMIFSGSVCVFNTITDVVTHNQALMQSPAALDVAGLLYHSDRAENRIKNGAAEHVRQLSRVAVQLSRTWDFHDQSDAQGLFDKLPKQFDDYKK